MKCFQWNAFCLMPGLGLYSWYGGAMKGLYCTPSARLLVLLLLIKKNTLRDAKGLMIALMKVEILYNQNKEKTERTMPSAGEISAYLNIATPDDRKVSNESRWKYNAYWKQEYAYQCLHIRRKDKRLPWNKNIKAYHWAEYRNIKERRYFENIYRKRKAGIEQSENSAHMLNCHASFMKWNNANIERWNISAAQQPLKWKSLK